VSDDYEILASLLPAYHRELDRAGDGALEVLLRAIAGQWSDLRERVDDLYDDVFVETCSTDLVRYFAEELGLDDDGPSAPSDQSGFALRAWAGQVTDLRRRRGTLGTLASAAHVATGWSIHVQPGSASVARTQPVGGGPAVGPPVRPPGSIDVRDLDALAQLDRPWSTAGRLVDLRSGPGPAHTDLSVWRIPTFPVQQHACAVDGSGPTPGRAHTFNPFGLDQPLHVHPVPPETPLDRPTPGALARPIGRADLARLLRQSGTLPFTVRAGTGDPVRAEDIAVADLSSWRAPASPHAVVVDPERGRLWFHDPQPDGVTVDYAFGLSGAIGAGPTHAPSQWRRPPEDGRVIVVGPGHPHPTIGAALDAVRREPAPSWLDDDGTHRAPRDGWRLGATHGSVSLVAAVGRTPALVGDLHIESPSHHRVELVGLAVDGVVTMTGPGSLVLTRCTLVPRPRMGLALDGHRGPVVVSASRCILGSVVARGSVHVSVRDSIVDGRGRGALGGAGQPVASVDLGCVTVLGTVSAGFVALDRCIVTGGVRGPDGPVTASWTSVEAQPGTAPIGDRARFTSEVFGQPGYAQLAPDCPPAIRHAGPDGSEPGVWHALGQDARGRRLAQVVGEFLPAGQTLSISVRS